ncbi:hypothetical protein ACJIZ3_016207 [Penstemon smallii]|uniref:Uncharacterized protein n=1 Tax=Penstemon smallii TaxID=265156 RepID=A0ABD3RPQ7_9LAMI
MRKEVGVGYGMRVNAVGFWRVAMKKSTRPVTFGLPKLQTAPAFLISSTARFGCGRVGGRVAG